MKTDDLISRLAADLQPSPPGAASRRLVLGAGAGTATAALGIVALLGMPLASIGLTGIPAFTMKLFFSVSLVGIAWVLMFLSGRPGRNVGKRILWLVLPLLVVAITATIELARLSPSGRAEALFGQTWQTCLATVAAFSVPIFLGIAWGFRRLAPTRLRLTGFLSGIAAGALSAALYALYCPETTATFLVTWYVVAIAIAGAIGAMAGPRLLRW
jgi:hypothetical protein